MCDDFVQGLQIAKGDRLVDVIRIWGFRISQEQDPTVAMSHLAGVLPEFLRILDDPQTDVGLRGVVAEALAEISMALETVIEKLRAAEDSRLSQALALRATVIGGFRLCFERKTAVSGLTAIAASLGRLELTPDVQELAQRIWQTPSPGVRGKLASRLRPRQDKPNKEGPSTCV